MANKLIAFLLLAFAAQAQADISVILLTGQSSGDVDSSTLTPAHPVSVSSSQPASNGDQGTLKLEYGLSSGWHVGVGYSDLGKRSKSNSYSGADATFQYQTTATRTDEVKSLMLFAGKTFSFGENAPELYVQAGIADLDIDSNETATTRQVTIATSAIAVSSVSTASDDSETSGFYSAGVTLPFGVARLILGGSYLSKIRTSTIDVGVGFVF